MTEPAYLNLSREILESGPFLGIVFAIVLMPYVAGYYGRLLQQRFYGIEFLIRLGSLVASATFAVVFFQTFLPLPSDWQQDYITVLIYIASMSAGIIIWSISYSLGAGRIFSDMVDRNYLQN